MRGHSIHSRPEAGPEAVEAVGERFVWTAFLFTPFWALAIRSWGMLGLWVLALIAIAAIGWLAGREVMAPLYGLFALWCGFSAPQAKRAALARRGYIEHGDMVAGDRLGAEAAWVGRLYGGGR